LSGPVRYRDDGAADLFRNENDPVIRACKLLDHWQEQLGRCDIFLADLNDYNGQEPCGGTAFEAGAAWRLGKQKQCRGYMDRPVRMLDRIPNFMGLGAAG
jgi:nucleoside 2-deoxyribosyltransferase